MDDIRNQIEEIVDRETRAWDTQDVELLMTIFHHDMVWPWPRTPQSHDPLDWVIEWGRYDYERWKSGWQNLFDTHRLARNVRQIKKIEISKEGDGAFAVVDIDTLWIDAAGNENHWQGRVCKVYAKVGSEWKMTMHTGVLDYSGAQS
jgi:ketosteroid isomerase-like protein